MWFMTAKMHSDTSKPSRPLMQVSPQAGILDSLILLGDSDLADRVVLYSIDVEVSCRSERSSPESCMPETRYLWPGAARAFTRVDKFSFLYNQT